MQNNLNSKQKEAAEAPNGPLLIVAGAGTGKTKTLTTRMIHLINQGARPESICAITFTNKAAKEMKERVLTLPGDEFAIENKHKMPFLGTFHSLGSNILRQNPSFLGRTKGFVIFDDHDSFQLVKKILKRLGYDKKTKDGPGFFIDKISAIKNGALSENELLSSGKVLDLAIVEIFQAYESGLRESNAFDFDDLITKVVHIFKTQPHVLSEYNKRFKHILVDEYQDLNNTQYQLVQLLAKEAESVSVVGDDQQTIYSWRGSNLEIFLGFERDWPNAKVVLLEENYRSSSTIIEAASTLVGNNKRQKTKKLWTKNPAGDAIVLLEATGDREEAGWIAELATQTLTNSDKETMGVLYRTNAQSRAIEQALIEKRISYQVFGGLKFYERREIKDIVAGLRIALNQKDAMGQERMEKNFSKTAARAFAEALQEKEDREPLHVLNTFLESTHYLNYVEKSLTNPTERKENIAELIRFATQFSELSELLQHVTLLQTADETKHSANPPRISLMTVHLAKGLEFDRVFVAGINEGILPHARSLSSEAQLEEERRLMYVAMTRARKNLHLGFYDIPSRFLSEIPQELMSFQTSSDDNRPALNDEERYITLD